MIHKQPEKVVVRCLVFLASPREIDLPSETHSPGDPKIVSTSKNDSDHSYDCVYFVDGGIRHQNASEKIWRTVFKTSSFPQNIFWIGDRDSAETACELALFDEDQVMMLPQDKSFSDFAGALDRISQRTSEVHAMQSLEMHVFGGLGGRLDHQWANLSEASLFVSRIALVHQCHVKIFFEKDVAVFMGEMSFSSENIWSVFKVNSSLDFSSHFEIINATYSGQIILQRPSHGLSNSCIDGESCTLISRSEPLLLFFN
jgi:hypothetical protein